MTGDRDGDRFVEQPLFIEQVGVSGHRLMQHAANLDLQSGALLDEIALMTGAELQHRIFRTDLWLDQAEALASGMEDSFEIMIVGLPIGMDDVAVVPGSVGVNLAGVEACLTKGPRDRLLEDAGQFDGDDRVDQVRLIACGPRLQGHRPQGLAVALDGGRLDNDGAVEVS